MTGGAIISPLAYQYGAYLMVLINNKYISKEKKGSNERKKCIGVKETMVNAHHNVAVCGKGEEIKRPGGPEMAAAYARPRARPRGSHKCRAARYGGEAMKLCNVDGDIVYITRAGGGEKIKGKWRLLTVDEMKE